MPGLTKLTKLPRKELVLPETKNNPPPSMASGLASVTAMNQGNGMEDKAGSQFSNKVINDDFVPQLNSLQVFGANLFSSQCQNLPQLALYNPNYLLR
ncbi:hypothetical protein ACP8HZ_03945 [Francisella noatunensis]